MNSFKRSILRLCLDTATRILPDALIGRFVARLLQVPDQRGGGRKRVMVLSHEGFRGDLKALQANPDLELWILPTRWQTRVKTIFYADGLRARDVINPALGSPNAASKAACHAFWLHTLHALFRQLPFDAVISYHIRLPADIDIGTAAKALDVPYLVFYREGMIAASERDKDAMRDHFQRLGKFQGSVLTVHTELARALCIEAGYTTPDQVVALGCLRMDDFLKQVADGRFCQANNTGVAVLFPVAHVQLTDEESARYFRALYRALYRFFADRPDLRLIIKPKAKELDYDRSVIAKALEGTEFTPESLPNITITDKMILPDAFLECDIVMGLNSTVILEAAVSERAVIVPFFPELSQGQAARGIWYRDAFAYFDQAQDADALISILTSRFEAPQITDDQRAGRQAMFEKYVSALDGKAVARHAALIQSCAQNLSLTETSGTGA